MEELLNCTFTLTAFDNISEVLKHHLNTLPSSIDSFLEDHILKSTFYQITFANQHAGFTAIHNDTLITAFVLLPAFKRYGQDIFTQIKKLEQVQAAFVPTCDEFFLSHALDTYRQLIKQAYFFAAPLGCDFVPSAYTLRQATYEDIPFIEQETDGFFDPVKQYIDDQTLFLTEENGICVGFGVLEKSRFGV